MWLTVAFGAVSTFSLFRAKPKARQTVVMLSEDGSLVEIDRSLIKPGSKKISDGELQSWIKMESSNHKSN